MYAITLLNSVEKYAKQWAKHEKEDLDTLSEWIKSVRCMLKSCIKRLKRGIKNIKNIYSSIFNNLEVKKKN